MNKLKYSENQFLNIDETGSFLLIIYALKIKIGGCSVLIRMNYFAKN